MGSGSSQIDPGSTAAGHRPTSKLRFGSASTHDAATRLLAVAHRWAYNRSLPTMAWPRLVELADRVRPGRLAELTAAYADRPAADLVPLVEDDLRAVTSSG